MVIIWIYRKVPLAVLKRLLEFIYYVEQNDINNCFFEESSKI